MKNSNVLIITIIGLVFLNSCNILVKEKNSDRVSLICLKENDTIYIKIKNNSNRIIYIPEYNVDHTENTDTLYFETIHKQEHNITSYYKYKAIFPFEFYSTYKINGIMPDSIETYKKQIYFYNQFRLQPMIEIQPDSSHIAILNFENAPKYKTIAKAVFYYKSFFMEDTIDKIDYLLEDVAKFDSINAHYIIAPITIRFR